MATAHQQFSLKWNNYSQHIVNALEELRTDDELTDVTLSCDGRRIKAHKVLLSACSVFFKETFKENPCKHPVVILKGVTFQDLQSVVHFMYNGQVNVSQERLPSFLQTAETLQIKGLTDSNNDKEDSSPSPAPVKKRPQQTFPSQTATAADSVRQDAEARPPTPKRKRVIGTTGGTFTQSAQNSELPGTASVISASGAVGSGSNNNSHHTNNNSAPASLISRNNSDNSVDGLPNVKYEEEHEMDDEYDRDNDNTYQDNGKDVFGGESNSLGSINTSIRTCTSLSSIGAVGERRPRYAMQPSSSSNDLVAAAAGVVDATNVNGRHNGHHMPRTDLIYTNPSGNFAHTNGIVVNTNGILNSSKLRHRLSSRSLSSGGSGGSGSNANQLQQPDHQDRIIKYAPLQSAHHSSSSHDSRSNSSHEDLRERHYLDDGSESMQGTDEDDELHQYHQHKRPPNGMNSILIQAHQQQQKGRSLPSLVKASNNLSHLHSQPPQQQPLNYRNTAVVNGTTNSRSNGAPKGSVGVAIAEDLSQSSPAAVTASEMSTPSFSLTQQLLQQNVLSLISSNGGTEVMKSEGGFAGGNRVSAITVQSSPSSSSNNGTNGSIIKSEQPTLPAPYVCDICGKRYVHHRSLNDHKKSHTGATRCPVCNKSFSKVANMRAHYQAQHGLLSENAGGGDASNSSSNDNFPPSSMQSQQQQNGRVAVKQMV